MDATTPRSDPARFGTQADMALNRAIAIDETDGAAAALAAIDAVAPDLDRFQPETDHEVSTGQTRGPRSSTDRSK